ncbi:MAG: substrate-binding domain-containing protein, partial [Acidiphilium sp.]|nr:substrate-binding domain-containing protein [Acidiphilium sp.]
DPAARRGTLRLGVSETIVHTWLPRFLEKFNATYPGLTLELDVDISTELRSFLLQGRIDLAFMVGPVGVPALQERPLSRFPVGFIASPTLDLPRHRVGIEELKRYPILTFARGTLPYAEVADLLERSNGGRPRMFASASMATLIRMALDGIGIAAIPPAIVRDDIANGRLVRLRSGHRLRDLGFVAAWAETSEKFLISGIADLAAESALQ